MDKALKLSRSDSAAPRDGPVVVMANWFQFGPGERVLNPKVESRMLLWCQKGKGRVTANGVEQALQPGDWRLLPWGHEVSYLADEEQPFLIGGVHVIPFHAQDHPVVFQVAHFGQDALAEKSWRRDAAWPGLEGTVQGHFTEVDRLRLLAQYVVEKFQHARPEEATMRAMAVLVVDELRLAVEARRAGVRPLPGELRLIQEYIRVHLNDRTLSVATMARVGRCSGATVHRLFRDHAMMTPARWLARIRVQQAERLLRTTTLSVREVGEQIGLPDPFHFSRFFKVHTGLSPRAYQRDRRFL